MKRKIMSRTFLGALLGLSLWTVFTILAAWLRGQWQFPAVSGHLVMAYGSELAAVTAQCVGAMLCGILWCNAALIFQEKDWSFPVQTGVHILACMIPAMAIAWFMHFMPHSLDGLVQYLRLFGLIYILNWAVQYFRLRQAVKQINGRLRKMEETGVPAEPVKQRMEEKSVKNKKSQMVHFPAIAAVLALCVCLPIAGMAAGNSGFFRDIMRGSAVIGSEYEQATGEMKVTVMNYAEGKIQVAASFLTPEKAPFCEFEELGVGTCRIVDAEGRAVAEVEGSEFVKITEGHAVISIPVDPIAAGCYELRIESFIGRSKADQDLAVKGSWSCQFTAE